MSRHRPALHTSSRSARTAELRRCRARIDALDAELVALLARRCHLSLTVARWKVRAGVPLYTPGRESEILRQVRDRSQAPLTPGAVARIFRAILVEMRALQRRATGRAGAARRPPPGT